MSRRALKIKTEHIKRQPASSSSRLKLVNARPAPTPQQAINGTAFDANIAARCEMLEKLLDEVLDQERHSELVSGQCRQAGLLGGASTKRRAKALKIRRDALAAKTVIDAVADGARTWGQIQLATKLDDDTLGFVLSNLIPNSLKTRDEGSGRFYFLPRDQRRLRF